RESKVGAVVVREDFTGMVLVYVQPGFRDLVEVFDLRREPRIGRIRDRPQHAGRLTTEHLFRQGQIMGITRQHVTTVVRGERAVSATLALLLARYFETSPEFWMNLQTQHDLWM